MNNKTIAKEQRIADIYNRHHDELKMYFFKYTHDMMHAEDMTHDLFIRLMDFEQMILPETARSFVFTIARRMVVDAARHERFVRQARQTLVERESQRFWQDCDTLECKQIRELELHKVRSLSPRMAQIYSMARYEDKSAQDMADALHISKRTVEFHLLMARKEVRQTLRQVIGY